MSTGMKPAFGVTRDGVGSYVIASGEKRYRVVYRVGGKVKSKGGFRTQGAAKAWRDKTRHDLRAGDYVDPTRGRLLFGPFAEEWVATADLRPSTRAVYEQMLTCHLAIWCDVPLAQITQTAVRRWVGDLRKAKATNRPTTLSRGTVAKQYRLLKRVMGIAVREGFIAKNPCDVDLGAEELPDLHVPSPADVLALADAVPHQYRALVLLAGFGGLRWGECAGLDARTWTWCVGACTCASR